MRWVLGLCMVCAASAQQVPFTLDQVMGFSFPSALSAAPEGGKVAWVANARGVRNIMIAGPPEYRARKITSYSTDNGQDIGQLAWLPGGAGIVFTRGGTANPDLNPAGATESIWVAAMDGSAPRKIADG